MGSEIYRYLQRKLWFTDWGFGVMGPEKLFCSNREAQAPKPRKKSKSTSLMLNWLLRLQSLWDANCLWSKLERRLFKIWWEGCHGLQAILVAEPLCPSTHTREIPFNGTCSYIMSETFHIMSWKLAYSILISLTTQKHLKCRHTGHVKFDAPSRSWIWAKQNAVANIRTHEQSSKGLATSDSRCKIHKRPGAAQSKHRLKWTQQTSLRQGWAHLFLLPQTSSRS